MARTSNVEDLTTLQMALVGYEFERRKIDDKIRELQAKIKGTRIPAGHNGKEPGMKRFLSASARARIAAAQRKRWAEHRRRAALAAKGQ